MAVFPNRIPAFRMPRLAVGGKPLRLRAAVGIAVLFLLLLLGALFHSRQVPSVSQVTRAPALDPKPGNANTNDYFRGLANEKAQRDAAAAAAAGGTYTPDMRVTDSHPNIQAPTPVKPQTQPTTQGASAPAGVSQQQTARSDKEDKDAKEAQRVYRDAMTALLASWGSKGAARAVEISPEERAKRLEQAQQAAQARAEAGTASAANGAGSALGGRAKQVLMPAMRWVTGRTVIATSSDSGGPVVAEITSGPLAGDRIKGTAQKHEDRLTVTLNELALADGRTVAVNAVLMAPDSKETAVASSVDHHYIPRIVLPTLAAGIQGLGQALTFSGSSIASGPYGASQQFSNFNAGQIAGIAAGTAAGQFNQILQQQTPKQSTVNLAADVDVGIMFLAPVEDTK